HRLVQITAHVGYARSDFLHCIQYDNAGNPELTRPPAYLVVVCSVDQFRIPRSRVALLRSARSSAGSPAVPVSDVQAAGRYTPSLISDLHEQEATTWK